MKKCKKEFNPETKMEINEWWAVSVKNKINRLFKLQEEKDIEFIREYIESFKLANKNNAKTKHELYCLKNLFRIQQLFTRSTISTICRMDIPGRRPFNVDVIMNLFGDRYIGDYQYALKLVIRLEGWAIEELNKKKKQFKNPFYYLYLIVTLPFKWAEYSGIDKKEIKQFEKSKKGIAYKLLSGLITMGFFIGWLIELLSNILNLFS